MKLAPISSEGTVAEEALAILRTLEYRESVDPEGLESSAFPDTFAPSAFHRSIAQIVAGNANASSQQRHCGCSWVFRHIDEQKIGFSDWHLSAFRMIVFFEASSDEGGRQRALGRALTGLGRVLEARGVGRRELVATYFGGAEVGGTCFPEDLLMKSVLAESGISGGRAVPIRGLANLTNVRRPGEPAGPRAELFARTVAGDWVEVATVVSELYLLEPGGRLRAGAGCVTGAALGLERLAAVSFGEPSVFSHGVLRSMVDSVEAVVGSTLRQLNRQSVYSLVDAVRTMAVILGQLHRPAEGRRLERLRRIAKRIAVESEALGIGAGATKVIDGLACLVGMGELALRERQAKVLACNVARFVLGAFSARLAVRTETSAEGRSKGDRDGP